MGSDWEDLMNGVFGSGGKLNFAGAEGQGPGKAGPGRPGPGAKKSWKPPLEHQRSAKTAADAVSGEQLLKNSAALDEQLKRQAREISEMGRDLTHNMQQDGLLSPQEARKPRRSPAPARRRSCSARRRRRPPAAFGAEGICDKPAGGFSAALRNGDRGRGGAQRDPGVRPGGNRAALCAHHPWCSCWNKKTCWPRGIAWMDLGLYAGPAQEKLFCRILCRPGGPGQVVAFENCDKCHAGCLAVLADLAVKGAAPLANRYVVQKGMLVEAGTAWCQRGEPPDAQESIWCSWRPAARRSWRI